jgi:cardiolipin synthase
MISFSRIALSPFLTYAIVNEMHQTAFLATAICGFSDWLDGYIAKNYNMKSVLGGFLDPLSDKIVIAALAIGLTAKGLLPVELTSVIVLRDVLLVAGSFYLRAQERPKGSTFFDTSGSATFKIIPSILSKANTGLQFSVVILTLAHFSFGHPPIYMIEPLWWITGTTTILSGVSYIDGSGIRRIKR